MHVLIRHKLQVSLTRNHRLHFLLDKAMLMTQTHLTHKVKHVLMSNMVESIMLQFSAVLQKQNVSHVRNMAVLQL